MPALPPVANVCRIRFTFTWGSNTNIACNLHAKYAGGGGPAGGLTNSDANSIAAAAYFAWAGNIIAEQPTDLTLTACTVTDLASTTGGQAVHTQTQAGGRAGPFMDGSTCVLVNHHIQRRYRGGKPRTYIPAGVGADFGTPQTWVSGYVNAVQNAWNSFVTALEAITFGTAGALNAIVSVSYPKVAGPPPGYGAPITDVILSSTVNPIYGS